MGASRPRPRRRVVGSPLAAILAMTALSAIDARAGSGAWGVWRTPVDGGSLVRLEACENDLCGRIVTSPHLRANPDQRDVRNRDPSQRGRALSDLLVLKVRPTGPDSWGSGWAYNPEDGATYKSVVQRKNDHVLKVTGCIVRPFCATQIWTRAD